MASQHAITQEANQLRSLIGSANAGKDEVSAARRTTVRQTFTAMSQLLDTALIRTAGVVDTLAESQNAQSQEPLYDHIKPGSPIEELLSLNETLMACMKALTPLNQPLLDACAKAYQSCDKKQIREDKIHDKAMALFSQLLREGTTWTACFCPTPAAAQAAIAAPNGSLARAFAKLTAPMADIQASVAAATTCVFAAGGVSAHQSPTMPGATGSMLELVEGHLHQNASNLLAHVVQSASAKDALAALPPHRQRLIKEDLFAALWDYRHRSATPNPKALHPKLKATVAAGADVFRRHMLAHHREAGLPPDAAAAKALAAAASTKLHELLTTYQNIFSRSSTRLDHATHIVALHSGVFVAVIQLKAQGSSEPVSVRVHPHDPRRPAPLWAGTAPHKDGSGVVWDRLTALASRALSYYRDRARLSGLRYPGAQAISDLLLWFATYFDASAERSDTPAAGPSVTSTSSAASGASAPTAPTPPARPQRRVLQKNDVLGCASAINGKHMSFDTETNGVLPALWRPYRIPSDVLRKACADRSLLQSSTFPCHLAEVEPEMQ
eukprot:jgi/Ulvmu1/8119/UM040_0014.1